MQDFQYGLSADKNQGEKVFQAFFQILSIALHPERELPDRRKLNGLQEFLIFLKISHQHLRLLT